MVNRNFSQPPYSVQSMVDPHPAESKAFVSLLEMAALWLFFLGIYLFVHLDALPYVSSHFLGEGDSNLYIWITEGLTRKFHTFNYSFFSLPFFYPFGQTLAYSDNYLLPAGISSTIRMFASEAVAYNVPLLIAAATNGFATCLLLRYLTDSFLAGVFSGTALMLSPWIFAEVQHPQLQYVFWFPFGLLSLLKALDTGSGRSAFLVGVCLFGSFLCSVYYFFFLSLLLVLVFLAVCLLSRPKPGLVNIVKPPIYSAPSLLIVWWLSQRYQDVAEAFGSRSLKDVEATLSWNSLLTSPASNRLWADLLGQFGQAKVQLFPGAAVATLFILGLFGFLFGWPRTTCCSFLSSRKQIFLLILVGGFFALLGYGPGKVPKQYDIYPYLFFHLPGFSALRAAGRAGILLQFAVIAVAGFGAASLAGRRGIFRMLLISSVILAVIFEMRTGDYPLLTPPPTLRAPLELKVDSNAAVIVLPYPEYFGNEREYSAVELANMLALRDTSVRLVNGYSGVQPTYHKTLGRYLKNFPDEQSIQRLSELAELRWIVVKSRDIAGFRRDVFENRLQQFSTVLSVRHVDEEGIYYLQFTSRPLIDGQRILLPPLLHADELYCLSFLRDENFAGKVEVILREEATDGSLGQELAPLILSEELKHSVLQLKVPPRKNNVEPLRVRFQNRLSNSSGLRLESARRCG